MSDKPKTVTEYLVAEMRDSVDSFFEGLNRQAWQHGAYNDKTGKFVLGFAEQDHGDE